MNLTQDEYIGIEYRLKDIKHTLDLLQRKLVEDIDYTSKEIDWLNEKVKELSKRMKLIELKNENKQ